MKPKYYSGSVQDPLNNRKIRGTSLDSKKQVESIITKTNTPPNKSSFNLDYSPNDRGNGNKEIKNLNSQVQKVINKVSKYQKPTIENNQVIKQQRTQTSFYKVAPTTPKKSQHTLPSQRQSYQPPETKNITNRINITQSKTTIVKYSNNQQQKEIKDQKKSISNLENKNKFQKTNIIENTTLKTTKQIINSSSTKQSPKRTSFSPFQTGKQNLTPRIKSPGKIQYDSRYQPLYSLIRPLFQSAMYYQSCLLYFLKDHFQQDNKKNKLQFSVAYSKQEIDYFKQIYCEHFNVTYNSLQHCKTLKIKTKPKSIQLNNPQQPLYAQKHQSVRTLVFDLDETLIHCNDQNDDPTDFEVTIHMPNDEPSLIKFNIRPFCQQMIQILSFHYELILFTASYQEYADKILEKIDPEGQYFSYRFYRDSCVEMDDGLLIKDLSIIEGRQIENISIIDNSAYSYYFQIDNGIPIVPFYDEKKDRELIYLTDYLIKLEKERKNYQDNWIVQHRKQFKTQTYLQCQKIEDCINKILYAQNY